MDYWTVDDSRDFTDLDSLCDYVFDPEEYDDDDLVRDYINDIYGDCGTEINGYTFDAAGIVEYCSSDLWCDLRQEWQEHQAEWDRDEYYRTLDSMEDGDEEYINGYHITFTEQCDEEDDDDDDESIDKEEEIVVKTLLDHFQRIA